MPKIIKFLTVGSLNTVFSYAVYSTLLFTGLPYLLALLIANILGVLFNYFSYGHIVFSKHQAWLVFFKFIIMYTFIFILNALGLSALVTYFQVSPYVGQVLCIIPSVMVSWLLMHYWVFN